MRNKTAIKTSYFIRLIGFVVISAVTAFIQVTAQQSPKNKGAQQRPVKDSLMTKTQAFDGLDPNCPVAIRKRQRIVTVKYYSFDGKIHQGQLVIDKELVQDIKIIFNLALQEKFPINSAIPISHPRFRKDGRWDDDLSMIANNTSGFNYREKTGGGSLSNHAYGRAIDINTVQNPYLKGNVLLPPNGGYDPQSPGTFTAESPIVKKFLELDWTWGGNWSRLKDYQHFEKPTQVKK